MGRGRNHSPEHALREKRSREQFELVFRTYESESTRSKVVGATVCVGTWSAHVDPWLGACGYSRNEIPENLVSSGLTVSQWKAFIDDVDRACKKKMPLHIWLFFLPVFWPVAVFYCCCCEKECKNDCRDRKDNLCGVCAEYSKQWKDLGLSVGLQGTSPDIFNWGDGRFPLGLLDSTNFPAKSFFGLQIRYDRYIEELCEQIPIYSVTADPAPPAPAAGVELQKSTAPTPLADKLLDLKKSLDAGLIDEVEFSAAKERLMTSLINR